MTLRVRITWVNPGTVLLPDDGVDISLEADGKALTVTSVAKGVRDYEVPDGTTTVDLDAKFSATFDPVTLASGTTVAEQEHLVWEAEQSYKVVHGTELTPVFGFTPEGGNPLVETTNASSVNGGVQIRLRTEFVSLGHFWKVYASGVGEWLAEHDPKVNLSVLGYTGGKPLIWFASVPEGLKKPTQPDISCLVFYRPENDGYTQIDQQQDQSRLNRYLLKQVTGSTVPEKAEVFLPFKKKGGGLDLYGSLRCGFEDALARSGKTVLMLHPWPNKLAYGDAAGGLVPTLVEDAIRFLWGSRTIGLGDAKAALGLGRLGLAGFSAGGIAMQSTLKAAGSEIDELYSFDARGLDPTDVIQWFGQKPTSRCLRMTAAFRIATHLSVQQAIEKASGATTRMTVWPSNPSAYDAGSTPLWDQALSLLPNTAPKMLQDGVRKRDDFRHQFAIFGGSGAASGSSVSFLQEFLQGSDF